MKCPHCLHDIFPASNVETLTTYGSPAMKGGPNDGKRISVCIQTLTCPNCNGITVVLSLRSLTSNITFETKTVYPRGGQYPPAPSDVPSAIAADYAEANEVLQISAKASAALSRRCLQSILSAHGYKGRDLMKQVEAAINEADASKALPTALRENIDAIRNFGNFSAHPITDQTTLQIVEVEEGEAEWCLQILLDMFDHYYVAPAKAAARRAALASKLTASGKPAMK
jgi:Domain of unknown function (DUF4145)